MPVKIGIDIGSSTTKIVAFEGEHMLPPMAVKADSQVASLYGAFGRYLYENNLELADVEGVYITGVGSKYVEKAVYDRPTYKVDPCHQYGYRKLLRQSDGEGDEAPGWCRLRRRNDLRTVLDHAEYRRHS